MAIVTSDILWSIDKSIGNHKFTTQKNGKIIASMKGSSPTFVDPADEENRNLRIKGFSGSGHLAGVLVEVIDLGYREAKFPKSPANLFVEDNALTLCTARRDENNKIVKEYDFLKMKVARGSLDPVNVTATYTADTRKFIFEQDGDVIIGGKAAADDVVYACVFESARESVALVELKERGNAGSTSFDLPAGWEISKTFVYVFANGARKRLSSPSTRAYPAPTEQEMLDARIAELIQEEEKMREEARKEAIVDQKRRKVEAMLAAREASTRARVEAIAAGMTLAMARQEENRVYDEMMSAARIAEIELDSREIEEQERRRAAQRERDEAAKRKAKEHRKIIAARIAAEREAEKEERRKKKEKE